MTESLIYKFEPGDARILGVTRMGKDVNFAVAIGGTSEVLLKLYKNATDSIPEEVIKLDHSYQFGNIFAVKVKNFAAKGYTYSYEAKGVNFIDPYAKLISGREHYGRILKKKAKNLVRAYVNSNPYTWKEDKKPEIPFNDLIIYKLHIRGFSMQSGGAHKGTYRGLADKAAYLKDLGINAVLLMPVMEYNEVVEMEPEVGVPEFVSSKFFTGNNNKGEELDDPQADLSYILDSERKINFWGYTSFYQFFAPKASYAFAPDKADSEFKGMVETLHKAGIEVIVEVSIPAGTNRSMMLDALRFWVSEYHVDGFKLNLDGIDSSLIAGDPYLSGVKLIGNGWNIDDVYPRDYTPDSKRIGFFNYDYQEIFRRFNKSDEGMIEGFVRCITANGEKAVPINLVTDHNGFTLADVYSYDSKHNEANGEHNRDGSDKNYSWNCGAEGPDSHKKVKDLRMKMRKNAILSLMLSQGVPMLLAGDEFGNSQNGNNNAYCQDNEIGWVSWKKTKQENEFLKFVKEAIALRKAHPVFHNVRILKNADYLSSGYPDLSEHSTQAWYPDHNYNNRSFAILLSGAYAMVDKLNKDDTFYVAFNGYWDEKEFELPHGREDEEWQVVMATDKLSEVDNEKSVMAVTGRCIAVLKLVKSNKPIKKKVNISKKPVQILVEGKE